MLFAQYRKWVCLFFVLVLSILTGCTPSVYTGATLGPSSAYVVLPKNAATDSGFTVFTALKAERDAGILVGVAIIKSTSAKEVKAEYQFTWFDQQGQEVGSDKNWNPVTFAPKATHTLKGTAPNAQAMAFKVVLKMDKTQG
jgi:uncharacterized protein YcfL